MGVEYYLVCQECKEWIDLHKAYKFFSWVENWRPPKGGDFTFNNYWDGRAVWFMWKHKEHKGIEVWTDCNDEWWNLRPYLTEVFEHRLDITPQAQEIEEK